MSEYEIEKRVPLPPFWTAQGGGSGPRYKYPFPYLKPGDSFVAPIEVRTVAYNWAKRHGKKLSVQKVDEDTIRIWRIDGLDGYDLPIR